MKISTLILAIWLAASAWAQAPPPKQQPGSPAAAKSSAATPQTAKQKPAASPAKAPAQSPARRHGRKLAAERPAARKTVEDRKPGGKRQRDPFVSPIVERPPTGANCTGSGRQCLLVGDIVLQGVVRYTGGYVAVVTSGDHTYFLHDNDPLADGDVARITKDSITLRQRSTDILGRTAVHEVTKKLGVPAV